VPTKSIRGEEHAAERTMNALPLLPLILDPIIFQPVFRTGLVVPALALMKHLCLRDATAEDHGVHREFLLSEMGVEEVECANESCRQQRLVEVRHQLDVDHPSRHEPREEYRVTTSPSPTAQRQTAP